MTMLGSVATRGRRACGARGPGAAHQSPELPNGAARAVRHARLLSRPNSEWLGGSDGRCNALNHPPFLRWPLLTHREVTDGGGGRLGNSQKQEAFVMKGPFLYNNWLAWQHGAPSCGAIEAGLFSDAHVTGALDEGYSVSG